MQNIEKIQQLTDNILNLIEISKNEDLTQSDLQAMAQAIAIKVYNK